MAVGGSRRDARARAVELLYEAEAKSAHPGDIVDGLPLPTDPYAVELASGVADHQIELDALLGRYAKGWTVARMAAMDLAVLRLGALELATQHDVPTGVCLSEAVELGGRYGSTDDTSRFVNGVLAAVAAEVRDGPRPWDGVRAVVFDMDGVLRHWTGERVRAFEEHHGLPAGAVTDVAFAQPLLDEAMTGTRSAEEWADEIARRLVADHPTLDVPSCVEMWLEPDWRVDADMVDVVERLRDAGTTTALFSNASTHLEADLETIGIRHLFEVVANSSRLGLAKPAVAAFEAVAARIGLPPHALLFVDDRDENVAGAVAAGWHAVLMRGTGPFGAVLRRLGVAGAPSAA